MQSGMFEYSNGILGPSTATAQGIVTGTQRYNRMAFTISGLASETISIFISYDWNDASSTGTFGAVAVRPIDLSTGANFASNTLGNGNFMLVNTPWRAVKFVKTSTVDNATIAWSCLNAN